MERADFRGIDLGEPILARESAQTPASSIRSLGPTPEGTGVEVGAIAGPRDTQVYTKGYILLHINQGE